MELPCNELYCEFLAKQNSCTQEKREEQFGDKVDSIFGRHRRSCLLPGVD